VPTQNKKTIKIKLPVVILIIVVLVGLVVALELTGSTHIFHKKRVVPAVTASQETKGEEGTSAKSSTAENNASSSVAKEVPGDAKGNGDVPSDSPVLLAPSGNFVSAHNVPSDAAIVSVCNTTPGASCVITFTSGNVKKSLTSQVTDRGGSAYWNSWTPKDIGLSTGSWQISATASLNGKTQSSSDAMPLVVKS
jgi:hypothetical protein